jgi:hypothetical protein
MIADPRATWGITAGNPIWEEMLEVAQMTNPTFLLNDLVPANTSPALAVTSSRLTRVAPRPPKRDGIVVTVRHRHHQRIYPLDQNSTSASRA